MPPRRKKRMPSRRQSGNTGMRTTSSRRPCSGMRSRREIPGVRNRPARRHPIDRLRQDDDLGVNIRQTDTPQNGQRAQRQSR